MDKKLNKNNNFRKYWIWFGILLIIEFFTFLYLYDNHEKEAINQQKEESEHTAIFLHDIIKVNLQNNNYRQIEILVKSWYKSYEDHLGDLKLTASNGFNFINIHSQDLKFINTFTITKKIEYSHDQSMNLQLVVDLDKTIKNAQEYNINLFFIMISSSLAIAFMIFLTGRKNRYAKNLKERQEDLDDLLEELVQEVERRKESANNLIINRNLLQQAQEIALMGSWELNYQTGEFSASPEFFNIVKLPLKTSRKISLKELSKVTLNYNKILRESTSSNEKIYFDEECYVVDQFTKKITKTIRVIGKSVTDEISSEKVLRGIIQDITEKNKFENEIESANNDLKEMLHIVAHELQTPLVTVEGFSSLILENFIENADKQMVYYLERINTNALGMKKLINSILDISRLNTIKYPPELFNTISMIKNLKKEIEIISESEISILMKTFPEVPDIFGDRQRIYLVFRNLMLNAINYGGKNLEIGYNPNKGFYVKDDGIGIKNDYIERIFIPGERLKETEAEGTGMGLTFCKKILELHRGRIWAESEGKGFGSTFFFSLPMRNEES